jgi:uncharacterized membrane protein YphA (DoxX/SURF4 family)
MTTDAAFQSHDARTEKTTGFARHLPTAARVLMGLGFFASGIFGLLIAFGVMPLPQPSTPQPEGVTAMLGAIAKSGYFFPLIKITEAVVGVLLLANRFVPLALALIAPVLVNIVAFHAFLDPSGIVPGLVLFALELYLAWSYRAAYRPMLAPRVTPRAR